MHTINKTAFDISELEIDGTGWDGQDTYCAKGLFAYVEDYTIQYDLEYYQTTETYKGDYFTPDNTEVTDRQVVIDNVLVTDMDGDIIELPYETVLAIEKKITQLIFEQHI